MTYINRIFNFISSSRLTSKLGITSLGIFLYHILSKIFPFEHRIDDWLHQFSVIAFFTPSDVELTVIFLFIILFFGAKVVQKYQHRTVITIDDILSAIQNNKLEIVLQPKKCLLDKRIQGVECLIRWHHCDYGTLLPDQFIPLAETDVKVMKKLTEYVILHAAEAYLRFKNNGFNIEMAINVSALDMADPAIITSIINSLKQYNMPMEKLVLEVTETAIMRRPDSTIKVLAHLDSLGAKISLDDFGTGHSSFLYLKHFPVKEIKIDKIFVSNLLNSEHEKAIVRSTIQLAHDIGARVVAEGVEDRATQKILTDLECDYVQGYYIAKPMTINNTILWLKNNNEVHNDATSKMAAYTGNVTDN